MKNITILTEKYCDLNPSLGTTSGNSNIIGSIRNIANTIIYHYDEYLIKNNHPIDNFLINELKNNKPDYLIVSYFPVDNDSRNVKLETFVKIKSFGIPIIFIWFDFGHYHIRNLALKIAHVNTLNIVIDTTNVPDNRFLPLWVPQDEMVFNLGTNKDINVSFVGSTLNYPDRLQYLNYLKNHISFYIGGGQREHNLSMEGYADILKRSKISINFPNKSDGTVQAKSRIYESLLCGALLLEWDNEAIKKWFNPMEHYVPFTTESDLLTKIRYYLEHEEERIGIAMAGHKKMVRDYSSMNWWKYVLNGI